MGEPSPPILLLYEHKDKAWFNRLNPQCNSTQIPPLKSLSSVCCPYLHHYRNCTTLKHFISYAGLFTI